MSLEEVTCPICDGQTTKLLYTKFELPIVRCTKCKMVRAHPRLPLEEVWKRYNPAYFWEEYLPSLGVRDGQYDLNFFDQRHAPSLSLISKFRQPPGKLLEVGTGSGFFLTAAQRAGWTVSGIEISEEAVKFNTKTLGLDVIQGTGEDMVFPSQSFDVVVMFETIEHFFNPRKVLESVLRVLKPGGLLVISTPNFNAFSRWALGSTWAVLTPAEHLYYFGEKTLKLFLETIGFSQVNFIRRHGGFGVFETMNPWYTHAPKALRTKLYLKFVSKIGPKVYTKIQDLGMADTLLCCAVAPMKL